MSTFTEFKENIISVLRNKVSDALEIKKAEIASSMFDDSKKSEEASSDENGDS